jgi:predicted double-glycine peptidase
MRKTIQFTVLVLLLVLSFCATVRRLPQDAVVIPDVSFFGQEEYQCGPTALAIVLDYWYRKTGSGKSITPEQIASRIYSPSARGVLGLDLELYAKKQGFEARQFSGNMEDLRRYVDQHIPVIIFVDYGLSVYEVNHFMVVTGYTSDGVIVNSGREENRLLTKRELDKIWKKNGYWALAVKPSA